MGSDFSGIKPTSAWLKSYLHQIVFEPQVSLKGVLASFIHQGICSFFHLLIYIVAMVPVNILAFLLFSCTSILFMCPPPSNYLCGARLGWEQQPFSTMSHHHTNGEGNQPSFMDAAAPPGPMCVCSCVFQCICVWERKRERGVVRY